MASRLAWINAVERPDGLIQYKQREMKNVLVTNDDGIQSPGLRAAAEAMLPISTVSVVAPLRQQTAMGRSQTGNPDATLMPYDLHLGGAEVAAYTCDASPARTLGHGIDILIRNPALVVSGINYGENLGTSATTSGTVGAAMEAACRGIPAIAVSMETPVDTHFCYTEQNWDTTAYFLRKFARIVLERGMPRDVQILKIDVPQSATPETPWRLTTLSPSSYYETRLDSPSMDTRIKDIRIVKSTYADEDATTDVYAVSVDKVVSVTPMTIDFTSRSRFESISDWLTPS